MPKKRQSNFSPNRLHQPAANTSALATSVPELAAVPLPAMLAKAVAKIAKPRIGPAAKSHVKKSNFDRSARDSNVAGFVCRHRLVRQQDNAGRERFLLTIPSEAGGEAAADLSFLLDFPLLLEPVADALLCIFQEETIRASSVLAFVQALKGEGRFFCYLRESMWFNFSLLDLTTQEVNAFVEWLNRREGLQDITKYYSFHHMRRVFTWLQKSSKWKGQMHPRLQFPSSPWRRSRSKDTQVVEVIPQDELAKLYQACLAEATETMALVRGWRKAMDAAAKAGHPAIDKLVTAIPDASLSNGVFQNPYNDIGVLLATLQHHKLHLPIPPAEQLFRISSPLATAIKKLGRKTVVQRCFYPSFRDLVPFVQLMAIHLYYNQSTLLGSKVSDYSIQTGAIGRDELVAEAEDLAHDKEAGKADTLTLRANPLKPRAGGKRQLQVRPVTNDADNPASIWAFVQEWTQWVRPLVQPLQRNVLFIAVARHNRRYKSVNDMVQPFWSSNAQMPGGTNWDGNYKSFCKDHDLPYYPLSCIRPTVLDMIDNLYGGDIRMKAAAAVHAEEDTTYKRYSTSGQIARGDENLAWVLVWRERWRKSRGKIDPRGLPEGKGADVGAATPGWKCADPFSGPLNQEHGKPCKAYGMCPACPHASIDVNNPYAAAQALNLLNAVDKASEEMAPVAWLEKWAPVREKLVGGWLLLFSDAVLADAAKERLSPLPALE